MPPIIERPDALSGEPLLGVLRRRHPDVDIVVLPPQVPPVAPRTSASLEQATTLAARARTAIDEVVAGLEPGTVSALWWRQGIDGSHRHVARVALSDLPDPMALLAEADRRLTGAGWRVLRLLEPRPRLEATDGPLRLRLDAYPTAVQVEVVSEPLVLDDVTLRELRATGTA